MPGGCADEGFAGAFPSGSRAAAAQAAHGKTVSETAPVLPKI